MTMHKIHWPVLFNEVEFSYSRSSGPGGQNVNKVSSKATLHWQVENSKAIVAETKVRLYELADNKINQAGYLVISADNYRDQERNRAACLEKLSELLKQAATPPKVRRPTKVRRSAKEARLKSKQAHSQKKRQRRLLIEE